MKPELTDRDLELRIKGHLYEIREVNDEAIGGQQGLPMAESGYRTTLFNVADCADASAIDEVAAHIKTYIQNHNERPPNREVRRHARSIVSEAGYPATSYLNRA